MELQKRFTELLLNYTEDQILISSLWKKIHDSYTEKHRTYHNLKHLTEIFTYFDVYKNELENPNTMALSIFYHDIIYKVWNNDNEEKSANFAVKELSKILNDDLLQEIHQQIIATKTHTAKNNDTKWFIDFDLAILGKNRETYINYSKLIRQEYKSIPSFIYKKGRKKVLQHFTKKTSIFATEKFIAQYEQKAKENLAYELLNI